MLRGERRVAGDVPAGKLRGERSREVALMIEVLPCGHTRSGGGQAATLARSAPIDATPVRSPSPEGCSRAPKLVVEAGRSRVAERMVEASWRVVRSLEEMRAGQEVVLAEGVKGMTQAVEEPRSVRCREETTRWGLGCWTNKDRVWRGNMGA